MVKKRITEKYSERLVVLFPVGTTKRLEAAARRAKTSLPEWVRHVLFEGLAQVPPLPSESDIVRAHLDAIESENSYIKKVLLRIRGNPSLGENTQKEIERVFAVRIAT